MIPRNLTLFRFPHSLDLSDLEEHLAECALKPVGPLEMSSRGFVPPLGQHGEALSHEIDLALPVEPNVLRFGTVTWLTVGGEDKILPGAVVNDLFLKKLKAIEETEGRKPGGRTRKRLKDDLITELLPRAFVRPGRADVFIDQALGVVAIDTASRKVAESVVSEIRRALGSFPALPVNAEVAPRAILTGWISGDPLPEGLAIGDECVLQDPTDTGAVVRCTRQELSGDEIGKHLEAGKQATRLALTLDDHVSFVIGEDLVIRKFKLLDGAVDQLESADRDDVVAEIDARFALFAGEFRRLFDVLAKAFKLTKADA